MARVTSVSIQGLREVDAALGELTKATGRNVMRRAGVKALEPIAEAMRDKAPDDPRTGGNDLKASVTVTTKRPKRHRKESEVEVFAGPGQLVQATQQEFGNQNHGPQAFVRPSWDQGRDQILPDLIEAFWPEIKKAAERAARKTARLAAKG